MQTSRHRRDRSAHIAARLGASGALDAEYGRLEQRVYGIEQGVSAIVQQIERDRSELASQMGQDRAHFDARFSALQESVNERSKTPWSILIAAFSLIVTTMVALGTLAYLPIKTQMEDTKADLARLSVTVVPRVELEREWARAERSTETALSLMRSNQAVLVPRAEHEEKWRSQTARDADLQRQIDDVRRGFGETYSLRDALKTMQERLGRLELARR